MVRVIRVELIRYISTEGFLVPEMRLELTSLVFSLMSFQQDLLVKVYTIHFTNDYLNDSNKSLASAYSAILAYSYFIFGFYSTQLFSLLHWFIQLRLITKCLPRNKYQTDNLFTYLHINIISYV